jgi:pyruvate/2-oxoglutarate dehydrogenase complex dihydrolipoamide acyltransferase (E2) component
MSMTMEEGEFINWLITVGDTITKRATRASS